APVDLVWRGGREGDGIAALTPIAAAAPPPAAPTPVAALTPTAQAAVAPPIDRLVDEVMRRLDRIGRIERERRGL
ncbi:MAG: hypothetical protein JWO81_1129, partial [Alphaproteobacteria bacterium]|nr:hypothetical protein [Alphaproteobacteria bacterium]